MPRDDAQYSFAKLKGSVNYKEWAREMAFALQSAKLWGLITGDRRQPRRLVLKDEDKDDEDRLDKIDQREQEIQDFAEEERRVVGKIGQMCIQSVQQEFLALKAKDEYWKPSDLWTHLRKRYTLTEWSFKWATLNKLDEISYLNCKFMKEYQAKIFDIEAEIRDQEITIDEAITIKMLNNLGGSFATYLTILNESARNEEKFPARSTLFKNLADEESRMRLDSNATANLAFRSNNKGKSKENKPTNEDKKDEKKRNRPEEGYTC